MLKTALKFTCGLSLLFVQFAAQGAPATLNSSSYSTDGLSLRQQKKVAVGLAAAGAYGMTGLQLELNFSPEMSVMTGFGLSDNFQSFNFKIRKIIGGKSFLPYIAGGFARWYTSGKPKGPISKTTPDFLADKFLNSTEKQGQFVENLVYPSAGVQYVQLNGEWSGLSIYAELLMLIDIDDIKSAPVGELGLLFYF